MSLRKFFRLYDMYKDDFDMEMMLSKSGTTYAKAQHVTTIDEAIPF